MRASTTGGELRLRFPHFAWKPLSHGKPPVAASTPTMGEDCGAFLPPGVWVALGFEWHWGGRVKGVIRQGAPCNASMLGEVSVLATGCASSRRAISGVHAGMVHLLSKQGRSSKAFATVEMATLTDRNLRNASVTQRPVADDARRRHVPGEQWSDTRRLPKPSQHGPPGTLETGRDRRCHCDRTTMASSHVERDVSLPPLAPYRSRAEDAEQALLAGRLLGKRREEVVLVSSSAFVSSWLPASVPCVRHRSRVHMTALSSGLRLVPSHLL